MKPFYYLISASVNAGITILQYSQHEYYSAMFLGALSVMSFGSFIDKSLKRLYTPQKPKKEEGIYD